MLTKGFLIFATIITKAIGIFFMVWAAITLVPTALLAFKGQSDEKGILLFIMLCVSALSGGTGFAVFRYMPLAFLKMHTSCTSKTNANKGTSQPNN
jgi:hypothetical protein